MELIIEQLPAQYITQLSVQHVSASLSTPAADTCDQLHTVTSSSQPQKQSAMALVASLSQEQLHGTCYWYHSSDDQLSVAAFRRLLKTELFTRVYDSSLARSWLFLL